MPTEFVLTSQHPNIKCFNTSS